MDFGLLPKRGRNRNHEESFLTLTSGQEKKSKSGNWDSPRMSTTFLQEHYGLRVEEDRS